MDDIFTYLGMLIVFGAILFLAFMTTKLLGKRLSGASKSKTMKVIETLPIGLDRCLYLIRVGSKHYLFAASRKNMEMVSEIELDESVVEGLDTGNTQTNFFDFKRILEFYSGLGKRKETQPENQNNTQPEDVPNGAPAPRGISANIKKLQRFTRQGE